MGSKLRKIGDPLGLPDPLDLWGTEKEKAAKDAKDAAEANAAALASSQTTSPTLSGDDVSAAREAERQRKLALSGQSSTILTSSQGLGSGTTGAKTLLGS